jgi:tetratricopeptide (TPR) repeat protein
MKKILLSIIICFLCISSYAQEQITTELEKVYGEEKYDLIISEHSEKVSEYPAKAIYYVGLAYYMKADDNNVLKLMDLSIKKDKTDPDAYFIKGMTLNYMEQFEKAIESFNKAIEFDSNNANYFSGLGDSYFNQKKYKKALSTYISATKKQEKIDRPFTMIPQIYAELNQPEKALKAFYTSKENIAKDSDSYITALYNIGQYELLNKNYDKAEVALKELVEFSPTDYHSYSKLIQVYYGKKEYEKAEPYKQKLYQANKQGVLEGNLRNEFCFDQFVWNDKLVFGFERFAEKPGKIYYKHVFYVTDEQTGKTEFTIQTENSPISMELGHEKYIVGMDKNGTHSTFNYGIKENFEYDYLKKMVLKVLNEEIKATASSRKGKK